jgi:hypothetical protein
MLNGIKGQGGEGVSFTVQLRRKWEKVDGLIIVLVTGHVLDERDRRDISDKMSHSDNRAVDG